MVVIIEADRGPRIRNVGERLNARIKRNERGPPILLHVVERYLLILLLCTL